METSRNSPEIQLIKWEETDVGKNRDGMEPEEEGSLEAGHGTGSSRAWRLGSCDAAPTIARIAAAAAGMSHTHKHIQPASHNPHTHTHIYTHIYTCIHSTHTHTHAHTHTLTQRHMHTHIHTHTHKDIHTHAHENVFIWLPTCHHTTTQPRNNVKHHKTYNKTSGFITK